MTAKTRTVPRLSKKARSWREYADSKMMLLTKRDIVRRVIDAVGYVDMRSMHGINKKGFYKTNEKCTCIFF